MQNVELEDVITKLREELKKCKKSELIEMVIQSQAQVMDLVWTLDKQRKEHDHLRGVISSRPLRSVGGVTLP
ncbi:hypothetical protein CHUUTOTORO_02630 [Serratia phage vB_SmaM-ChuuTotoro]|nr:hypothetical protein CHUUTOTORO_02630 [Serratia phage vB_SmaM-ChuuTotoro]